METTDEKEQHSEGHYCWREGKRKDVTDEEGRIELM